MCDNMPMTQFYANDPGDNPQKLRRVIQDSGLTLQQICDRLKKGYSVIMSPNSLSRSMSRGTLQFQRVLQILAVCGVTEIGIVTNEP